MADCKSIALEMGLSGISVEDEAGWPPYCYLYNGGTVYFNKRSSSTSECKAQYKECICKKPTPSKCASKHLLRILYPNILNTTPCARKHLLRILCHNIFQKSNFLPVVRYIACRFKCLVSDLRPLLIPQVGPWPTGVPFTDYWLGSLHSQPSQLPTHSAPSLHQPYQPPAKPYPPPA